MIKIRQALRLTYIMHTHHAPRTAHHVFRAPRKRTRTTDTGTHPHPHPQLLDGDALLSSPRHSNALTCAILIYRITRWCCKGGACQSRARHFGRERVFGTEHVVELFFKKNIVGFVWVTKDAGGVLRLKGWLSVLFFKFFFLYYYYYFYDLFIFWPG